MTTAGTPPADRALLPDLAGRRELVGAWASLSLIHYFIVEAVAMAAWRGSPDYDRRAHVISDLGAAHCGPFNGYEVCSPLNWLMNASFILQGVAMILGAVLLSSGVLSVGAQPGQRYIRTGPGKVHWLAAGGVRVLVFVAGVGQAMVGLFPEDTDFNVHLASAGMYFIAGPLGLVLLGIVWLRRTSIAWMVLLFGATSLGATGYVLAVQLRVDEPGAIERTMAYPIILGLALVGITVAYRVHHERGLVRARRLQGPV
ncbi:DUF998 domain-containing protein [Arthrobacter sp. CJ23]|uniref:DUF998 domain-containing protein n=1 Tax=Arthrobacter sp. CJ23 TaxID=2972479 RepID=UPI00215D5674|nr:DUF998 domain-containing protein [Arthrobacter sp. CJ23]UVJ40439.1 DUF998 domain-containing protein [Arthrobacter sp. CJ23]